MQTVQDAGALRAVVRGWRAAGQTVGFVPTMGNLHAGHFSLIRLARARADRVVASVFVNPTQFGPGEDFERYPRTLTHDQAGLAEHDCDLLFAPDVTTLYPYGAANTVSLRVPQVTETLEGAHRPGHFDGVATVVCKLFNQVRPELALFGEKDWQQLAVIRRMARDLDLTRPHVDAIHGVPTVREADGLALSSRNRYLSPENRRHAATLPTAMREAIGRIEAGDPVSAALLALKSALTGSGFASIDYVELADAQSLEPLGQLGSRPARLLVAARIGGTRLIDNMPVGPRA